MTIYAYDVTINHPKGQKSEWTLYSFERCSIECLEATFNLRHPDLAVGHTIKESMHNARQGSYAGTILIVQKGPIMDAETLRYESEHQIQGVSGE